MRDLEHARFADTRAKRKSHFVARHATYQCVTRSYSNKPTEKHALGESYLYYCEGKTHAPMCRLPYQKDKDRHVLDEQSL